MSEKNTTKATPADVAAKAAEEKLVTPTVPAQATVEITEDGVTVTEGGQTKLSEINSEGKKSLKERLVAVGSKLKEHKRLLIALGAAAGVAAVAFAKYTKTQVEETLDTEDDEQAKPEETVTEEVSTDESAA